MDIRELLKKKLAVARPERYTMADREWIDEVADGIDPTDDFEMQEAFRKYVRTIAREVEGKATKAGNRIMREYHQEGALPFNWAAMIDEPIALENAVIVDGEIKIVKERVKLRYATARDFELWAETEDRARHRDFDARGESVSGAMEIAQSMRAANALTFFEWADRQDLAAA